MEWPDPRFTVSNGTVTDTLTGLIWLQNANCANATRNWQTALTDVAQLNTDGTMNGDNCGDTADNTDWRLPNRYELESLLHMGCFSPALPNTLGTGCFTVGGEPFNNVVSSYYWSSTTCVGYPDLAWSVYLNDGSMGASGKAFTNYVWPVRSGQ